MSASGVELDVVIAGAGPAGLVLGRALQDLGLRVRILHQERRQEALEGLSERLLTGLRQAGFSRRVAALPAPSQRHAVWSGQVFAGNRERVVRRTRFDAGLRAEAAAAGLEIQQARLLRLRRQSLGTAGWRVDLDGEDGRECIACRFLVEARGRAAPGGSRTVVRGPATTALGRLYEVPADTAAGGGIHSLAQGWIWWACDGAGLASLQLMLSNAAAKLPAGTALDALWQDSLAGLRESLPWLADARPLDRVQGRVASVQLAGEIITSDYARVGDAAAAVDPLSGHGIYQAVRGALALAPCINTLLRKPRNTSLALRFYREQVSETFWRMARIGRDFYAAEQRFAAGDFWRERRQWPDQLPAHPPAQGRWVVESGPVSVNGLIESRRLLRGGDSPRGVWQVAGVTLADLLDETDPAERLPPPGDPRLASARAWLAARGLITCR